MNTTDSAIMKEIGARLAHLRVTANLTQELLAEDAGVAKRTLERLENGESVQLTNFIRILRALDLTSKLDLLVPPITASPIELVDNKGTMRIRARVKESCASDTHITWKWGDEK
ncbi:transcriptional regulator [Fibrobacterales bacterium]|nr:transcriptional regulator [Fibrobacterales bacterium]